MDPKTVLKALIESNVVRVANGNNSFLFNHGMRAPMYIEDQKIPSLSVELYSKIVDCMVEIVAEMIKGDTTIMLASASSGSLQWTAMVAHQLKLKYVHVRSENKDHGMYNLIEGTFVNGQKMIIFDDVIATGTSSLMAMSALRAAGAEIVGFAAIFNYDFPTTLSLNNIPGSSLLHYNDLLPLLSSDVQEKITSWHDNPRTWKY